MDLTGVPFYRLASDGKDSANRVLIGVEHRPTLFRSYLKTVQGVPVDDSGFVGLAALVDGGEYGRPFVTSSLRAVNRGYLYVALQDGGYRYLIGAPIETTFMERVVEQPPESAPPEFSGTWGDLSRGTREMVFDVEADFRETRDVSADRPEKTAALRTALRDFVVSLQADGEAGTAVEVLLTEQERENLEAMGYL